ncbi:MAG: 2-dehydropantoate 2-reductase [Halioglobus sp.]|nr:2-dehydropantoate 2-reductase [Halioglobus sp.]
MQAVDNKDRPRIAVVGCGAIGGLLAARLIAAGHNIQIIERGTQLRALQRNGLLLCAADGEPLVQVPVEATDSFDCGAQDLVLLAVKSQQIPAIARQLGTIMHPETLLVTLQNGLPWWYFQRHGGAYEGQRLTCVDPEGVISRHIDPAHLLGCVAYPAAEVQSPGVIRHIEGDRFPLGELDQTESARAQWVGRLLVSAGFKAPPLADIRSEIWLKLWGVLAFNPISMLTRATMQDICRCEPTRSLAAQMMREAQVIASKLGITFRVPLEKRIAGAERVGAHKTSTLQDLEAGRATELEAILGSVIELARLTDTQAPRIESVYACCKLLEQASDRQLDYTQTSLQKIG